MTSVALIQVLGAVAYGERKAHEEAQAKAAASASEHQRRAWRKTAAEELRHYKGFVRRLEALGADPERAMRPYRGALDRYHGAGAGSEIEEAVWSYLGEGIADDLLRWLSEVVDPETCAFIGTVLGDEEGHEARATAELRDLLDKDPGLRRQAARAAWRMVARMASSGGRGGLSVTRFAAFLQIGRPGSLLARLVRGYGSRLDAIGIDPLDGLPPRVWFSQAA